MTGNRMRRERDEGDLQRGLRQVGGTGGTCLLTNSRRTNFWSICCFLSGRCALGVSNIFTHLFFLCLGRRSSRNHEPDCDAAPRISRAANAGGLQWDSLSLMGCLPDD